MKFNKYAKSLEKIEEASGRIVMTDYLVEVLKSLKGEEVKPAMYLLLGRVVPKFVSLEFNVARKLIIRALHKAFDKDISEIRDKFQDLGDLGLVAEKYNASKRSSLELKDVYKSLYDIAVLEGKGSQEAKIKGIAKLLKRSDAISSKYIVRIIIGKLRLGLSDKTVLDALSILAVGDKSKRKLLDKAYGSRGDIGYIAEIALDKGISKLEDIKITTGIPVASMLCEREKSEEKIFERSKEWFIQPKYDGLRCQVHYDKNCFKVIKKSKASQFKFLGNATEDTRIFSRNQENLTDMFPDIKKSIKDMGIDSIILDGEAVGYNEKEDKFIPFQKTIQRKRKYNVRKMLNEIPVKLYAFDLLYINGKDFSERSLKERIQKLKELFVNSEKQDVIKFTETFLIKSGEDLKVKFKNYVEKGLEGVVFKLPDSRYEPGKRGFDWIKLKKSTKGYLVDSIDAVVLGYYHGRGVRAKFGIGAILVGIYNKKKGMFESIAKVGTGIKDKEWGIIKKKLDKLEVKSKPKNVRVKKELKPDIWVNPEVVVVVDADEVTKSSNHTAGVKKGKGYSLRFPRLIEFDRKDKTAFNITTVKEITKL